MFNFIRDEWLNMIIARKQYVKDEKEKKKAAMEKLKAEKMQQRPPVEEEEKVKLPPQKLTPGTMTIRSGKDEKQYMSPRAAQNANKKKSIFSNKRSTEKSLNML